MTNLIRKNTYQTLSEFTSFCRSYDKNILVCFSVHRSNCCAHPKRNAKFHTVG